MNAMRTRLAALFVLGGALCAAKTAEAGIIIKSNGNVFLGRIDVEDFKKTVEGKEAQATKDDYEYIRMHSPQQYKGGPKVQGEMIFFRNEIRWYDMNADEPTDDYMKDHADEKLDTKYLPYVARWREAHNNQVEFQPLTTFADFKSGSLAVMPTPREWGIDKASIRRPSGWTPSEVNGITIFTSDQAGSDGYKPRIHFFTTEAAIGAPTDWTAWIKSELEKLANTQDAFEIKPGDNEPKTVRGGAGSYDCEWTTTTRRAGKGIKALRAMRFREHRAYFVTCYTHEKDFDKHLTLFRQVVGSLVINEGGTQTNAAEVTDVSAVTVGQIYTWKSANVPDQIVWEVSAKESTSVRHRTTTTKADGSKSVKDNDLEPIGKIDPEPRLTAICGAPANPARQGKETIQVGTQSFDCDVWEALANGKKYKLWLSNKFPMEIRLTVDGQLVKELSAIK